MKTISHINKWAKTRIKSIKLKMKTSINILRSLIIAVRVIKVKLTVF
jgi:hypothetical protein